MVLCAYGWCMLMLMIEVDGGVDVDAFNANGAAAAGVVPKR